MKTIKVLLNKDQMNYLAKNAFRYGENGKAKKDQGMRKEADKLLARLEEMDTKVRLLTLSVTETLTVLTICKYTMGVLSTKTIPEYEKRGDDMYKRRAEKRLAMVTRLFNKVSKKVREVR